MTSVTDIAEPLTAMNLNEKTQATPAESKASCGGLDLQKQPPRTAG